MRFRLAVIIPAMFGAWTLSYLCSYLLRFDSHIPAEYLRLLWSSLPVILLLKAGSSLLFRDWKRSFRFSTTKDVIYSSAVGLIASTALLLVNDFAFQPTRIPRSVLIIDAILTMFAISVLRIAWRSSKDAIHYISHRRTSEPTLIYGTGDASIRMFRTLDSGGKQNAKYQVVGFVQPGNEKGQSLIGGQQVHAASRGWSKIAQLTNARHLLIPSDVPGQSVREILAQCQDSGLKAHVIPNVSEIVGGRFQLQVRDVTINDLLRREPNHLDLESIRELISGRRVLVTGGAGSIGSEICRQVRQLGPSDLTIVDQSEFGVFSVEQEFSASPVNGVNLQYYIADVTDRDTLQRIFSDEKPEIVFHAAAYKHVPLLEDNPQSAVLNNLLGTRNVVDLADAHHVDRFVLISTDKAVRPTSVMGATKLLAEKYLQAMNSQSKTCFLAVRFGNVLNSAGSVVPTFRKQIRKGGPITVTHPDMERFFMTIPEAVQLVLQAGAIGEAGNIMILDMGQPVRIVDLAKDMIMLSGLRYPDDIDIVFTGLRPGEKLYEELFYNSEKSGRKIHDKIFSGDPEAVPALNMIRAQIAKLQAASFRSRRETLHALQETVAYYTDREWVPARLNAAA